MRIYRLTADGKRWPPALDSGGFFVLADPAFRGERHHAKNKVLVKTEEEAISLLRKGHSIRVKTSTSASLVRLNVYVDGALIAKI